MKELIAKYLANELDDEQRTEFEQKLIQDKRFAEQVEQHAHALFLSDAVQTNTSSFDAKAAWKVVKARIHPSSGKNKFLLKFAASFVILLTLSYALFNSFLSVEENKTEVSHITENEIKEIKLPDGSVAKLNRASNLSFTEGFGKSHRQVTLSGAAHFDVVSNSELPFEISTDNSKVSVLGTVFDLSAYPNEHVELNVTEGSVSFESTSAKIQKQIVNAGERAELSKDGKRLIREKRGNKNYSAWWTKQLVFENTPLKEVAKDLEKTYWVDVDIAEGLSNCKLDAVITGKSLDDVLAIIQVNFPTIQITKSKEKQIKLDGKSCTD